MPGRRPSRRARARPGLDDREARTQLHRAVDDDAVAFGETLQHLDPPGFPGAKPHRRHLRLAFGIDPEHEALRAVLLHGDLRHRKGLPLRLQHRQRQQHAGQQPSLRVVDRRADGDRARGHVDARIHAEHAAAEGFPGPCVAAGLDGLTRRDSPQLHFRDREIDLHGVDGIERGDRRTGLQELAGRDLAQAEDAREGSDDDAVGHARGRLLDGRLRRVASRALRVELARRDELALGQLALALELALGLARGRPRRVEIGHVAAHVEVDEHLPGLDALPAFETHALHALGELRRDGDRLAGARRADGLRAVDPRLRRDGLRGNDCRRPAARAGPTGTSVAAAGGEQQGKGGNEGGSNSHRESLEWGGATIPGRTAREHGPAFVIAISTRHAPAATQLSSR